MAEEGGHASVFLENHPFMTSKTGPPPGSRSIESRSTMTVGVSGRCWQAASDWKSSPMLDVRHTNCPYLRVMTSCLPATPLRPHATGAARRRRLPAPYDDRGVLRR